MASAAIVALVKLLQIPITLFADLNLDEGTLYPPERVVANNSCFDHIIVGGGTAGCAVGARLSENLNETVLILEAGDNPSLLSLLPPAFALFAGSSFDYNYTTEFDDYAASSQYGFTKFSAGKALGGTSSINHFILAIGSKKDYDKWAEITGDPSWSYESVFPYFKKKERLQDPEILASTFRDNHGLNGPGAITRKPKEYGQKYIDAFNETGSMAPLDITSEVSKGFVQSLFILNTTGIRQNTAYTYLTPIRFQDNLYVLRNTTVTLILFEGKRAVAVAAIRNGEVYVYRASKEIILCAGVFNSPKLLMLSGIGPKEHLESMNITVIVDSPAGQDLQDQVASSIVHRMEANILPPPLYSINPLDVPFPVNIGLESLNRSQEYADYQMFILPLFANTPFLELACAVVFQFRADLCDQFNKANILHNSLYTLISKTQPYSRGSVKLRSKNPLDDPVIISGYYTNKTDLDNMADYIIDYLKVENSTYFKDAKAQLVNPNLEQCKNYTFRTKEYWLCYLLYTSGSVYHTCGTCAMGSVVDSKLRVKGVTNLRVVDASVMPTLTNGSPYEAVQMIAEKGAELIKADADKELSCKQLYGTEEDCTEDSNTTTEDT